MGLDPRPTPLSLFLHTATNAAAVTTSPVNAATIATTAVTARGDAPPGGLTACVRGNWIEARRCRHVFESASTTWAHLGGVVLVDDESCAAQP